MSHRVLQVVEGLADAEFAGPVFNPWKDADEQHGCGPNGPSIRRRQLHDYFAVRRRRARWLLLGEAMGYQGGHFSGVPMTSERILLGHFADRGIAPTDVLPNQSPERTSLEHIRPKGFSEPTATIVWGAIRTLRIDPLDVALWNTFAWHPYRADRGLLSNRRPTDEEVLHGMPALKAVLGLFPEARLVAVGKVAAGALSGEGLPFVEVRHPAHGGAGLFREQLADLVHGLDVSTRSGYSETME